MRKKGEFRESGVRVLTVLRESGGFWRGFVENEGFFRETSGLEGGVSDFLEGSPSDQKSYWLIARIDLESQLCDIQ